MSDRAVDAPPDLPIRWTHDGLVCETRPWRRRFGDTVGLVGTSVAVILIAWPTLGLVLAILAVAWVGWDCWRDRRHAGGRLTLTLSPARLEVVFDHARPRRIALASIGTVEVIGVDVGHTTLLVWIAGHGGLEIPMHNESEAGARWLAVRIEQAARAAREGRGGPGDVPADLRHMVAREGG